MTEIRSMTGFGRGEARGPAGTISVEMRSVNNRYLDVQVKTPRSLAALEPRIRKAVQDRFSRGRIDVFVNRSGGDANPFRLVVNHDLANQYVGALRELKERFRLSGEADLSLITSLPDVIVREEISEDVEALWTQLYVAMESAAEGLRSMRETEGAALVRDIAGRLETIAGIAAQVRLRAPETVAQEQRRMNEALQKLLAEQPDPARVAQEIAILAERTDVTEELTRLDSHLVQFRRMISGAGAEPVGRKLDFLIQEMGREVNTIASKAQDAAISVQVVTAKAELEKVREQVQNIE
ncbi:MAG: YicC family protein [Nitrospiraceae bacterium]|nr:YicC family protein [Nitrospiraceae bacterium]